MKNKITIVYCHPYKGSFNHEVLMTVTGKLAQLKQDYGVIDLYNDQFDPRYSVDELAKFSSGQTSDPRVKQYQETLSETSRLIIITPVWWNDLPGMLKGFFDKVMKPQYAYLNTPKGVKGLLTNIESVEVFTTSTSPTWYLKLFCGNAVERVFMKGTLKQLGIKHRRWINCGGISNSTFDQRQKFLKQVETRI